VLTQTIVESIPWGGPQTESALACPGRDRLANVDRFLESMVSILFRDTRIGFKGPGVVDSVDSGTDEFLVWRHRPDFAFQQRTCDALSKIAFVERIERGIACL